MRLASTLIVTAVAATALAACSTPAPTTPSSSPSTTASSTQEPIAGGDPSTWAPVEFSAENSGWTVPLIPGQAGIINVDGVTKVETSDPAVVKVTQPVNEGDYATWGGVEAVKVGTAVVTAYNNKGTELGRWDIRVTEPGKPDDDMAGNVLPPVILDDTALADAKTTPLELAPGARVVLSATNADSISTSDPAVARVVQASVEAIEDYYVVPAFNAVAPGDAIVVVKDAKGVTLVEIKVQVRS